MNIPVNSLRAGMTFKHDNHLFIALEVSHHKSARGQGTLKVKAKNINNSAIVSLNFIGGSKIKQMIVDKDKMQYLYTDLGKHFFMHNETYEQFEADQALLADEAKYFKPGLIVEVKSIDGKIIGINLPSNINFKVKAADASVVGNTVGSAQKKAVLENGLEISVPIFVKKGEEVIINTKTGKYVGRRS